LRKLSRGPWDWNVVHIRGSKIEEYIDEMEACWLKTLMERGKISSRERNGASSMASK